MDGTHLDIVRGYLSLFRKHGFLQGVGDIVPRVLALLGERAPSAIFGGPSLPMVSLK